MLGIDAALTLILDRASPLEAERIPLGEALDRFNTHAMEASRDEPPFDNSAMDGYAVRAADVPGTLTVSGESRAGGGARDPLEAGHAIRIFTGAELPDGADAVVMQEDTTRDGDAVVIASFDPARTHVRWRGEVVRAGERLLAPASRLAPGEIAVLASQGYAEVSVHRRPRVAILSTGDELRELGETAAPNQLYNSNSPALAAMVRAAGGTPVVLGSAADDRESVTAAVREALTDCDLLITTGGVSVGDYDFVHAAFGDAGVSDVFWKVRIKPGKPIRFGVHDGRIPVLGLPGNPVSVYVTFEVFGRPLVRRMLGDAAPFRPTIDVELATGCRHANGRTELLRARLQPRLGDVPLATPHDAQGSAALMSMLEVDALLVMPEGEGRTPAGRRVRALDLRTERGSPRSAFD